MGYEYDFVFDWMVKKQQPTGVVGSQARSSAEEEKKDDPSADNEM